MARTRSLLPSLARPLAVVALVFCLGCKDEASKPKPSGERTVEPTPEVPKDAPTGPFADYDFEAATARWQGAWTLPSGEAWLVEGDRVLSYDPGKDATITRRFEVYSPCQVSLTDTEAGLTEFRPFAFAGERLHVSLAAATGTRVGETHVVCSGGRVYVLDAGACAEWSEMFDDWKSQPGSCKVEGEGATRRFLVETDTLRFEDEALLSEQAVARVALHFESFEAAKAALTAGGEVDR